MTAVERVLRAVEEVRRNLESEAGNLDEHDIRMAMEKIHEAAFQCPRCAVESDGDCACPPVRR